MWSNMLFPKVSRIWTGSFNFVYCYTNYHRQQSSKIICSFWNEVECALILRVRFYPIHFIDNNLIHVFVKLTFFFFRKQVQFELHHVVQCLSILYHRRKSSEFIFDAVYLYFVIAKTVLCQFIWFNVVFPEVSR